MPYYCPRCRTGVAVLVVNDEQYCRRCYTRIPRLRWDGPPRIKIPVVSFSDYVAQTWPDPADQDEQDRDDWTSSYAGRYSEEN